MHRHLASCAAMLIIAIGVLVLTDGSIGGMGVLLVALVCPLAMLLGVRLVLGERSHADHTARQETSAPRPNPGPSSR